MDLNTQHSDESRNAQPVVVNTAPSSVDANAQVPTAHRSGFKSLVMAALAAGAVSIVSCSSSNPDETSAAAGPDGNSSEVVPAAAKNITLAFKKMPDGNEGAWLIGHFDSDFQVIISFPDGTVSNPVNVKVEDGKFNLAVSFEELGFTGNPQEYSIDKASTMDGQAILIDPNADALAAKETDPVKRRLFMVGLTSAGQTYNTAPGAQPVPAPKN